MIKYLTFNHVVFIQNRLITQYGGMFGFRGKEGIALLESALARPMTTAFGQEMYATLFSKAAAICHSLAKNHVLLMATREWLLRQQI